MVVWVLPPPVPVMVMVLVPTGAVAGTLSVSTEVPEPGARMGLVPKVATEAGDADSVTAALKPPLIFEVIVEVPELPCLTVTVVGDADRAKSAPVVPVTVRVTVVVAVTPPPVPLTVIG